MKAIAIALILLSIGNIFSQSSTGSMSGTLTDEQHAAISGATVTISSLATGFARATTTDPEGRYRFAQLPIGTYELTVEAKGFSKYIRQGVTLDANQDAVVDVLLKVGQIHETVTVTENASLLNRATAEASTRFDNRRLAELPIAPNGSVFNVLLSVPGVSQLSPNQTSPAMGISFSANGGRLRSNSFLLDGQDVNDPVFTGGQIPLNNPDAIGEVRIVTNQFLAEYGHNAASVVNFIGKSGTNEYHGSGFVFYNGDALNSCGNLQKRAEFCDSQRGSPLRKEFRYGFTLGGPVIFPRFGEGPGRGIWRGTDKTFFFVDFLRWTDRQIGAGRTITAPTAAGRATLQQSFGHLPQVQAMLVFVPPGTSNFRSIQVGNHSIQVGSFTASAPVSLSATQSSFRIDHRFNDRSLIYGRYRGSRSIQRGEGQITPPGLTTTSIRNAHAATVVWNSAPSSRLSNETRIAWTRFDVDQNAENPASDTIPSIEINDLDMINATGPARTAFGLVGNLPVIRINDTYQITDSLVYFTGRHSFKFGVDFRRTDVSTTFLPNTRGRVTYATFANFLSDTAQSASINFPLPGGDTRAFFRWHEFYVYAQDEWKLRPNFTLTLGLRYEYPGDSFRTMKETATRILAANDNHPAFAVSPLPPVDTNNFMPRVGFNWNPRTARSGVLGLLTGGDQLVLRGGYARTYDSTFVNINLNSYNSFPFVITQPVPNQGAFARIQSLRGTTPTIPAPSVAFLTARLIIAEDFRAPATDQFSLEFQRALSADSVAKIGYIRTRGTGLLQTVSGNPRLPCVFGTGPFATTGTCNNVGYDPRPGPTYGLPITVSTATLAPRVDPTRGVIDVRTNAASSTYDALQLTFERRLSRGFGGGVHYTWSTFIDTLSEVFATSAGQPVSPADPYDRNLDRARSSYDRPHRLTGNFVYELPFYRKQIGTVGKLLGGWQVNPFFSFQSGPPFSVLNGSDPTGAFAGTAALDPTRPNVYTNLDVSGMTVAQLWTINQQLLAMVLATAQASFAALPPLMPGQTCREGPLPGPSLNNLLFARATARITCVGGVRNYIIDFQGIEPGQRVGGAGRNILRGDGFRNVDLGIIKNTQLTETVRMQLRADVFNLFNWRNFGIPNAAANSLSFLDQWATDGGNRRIILAARLVF